MADVDLPPDSETTPAEARSPRHLGLLGPCVIALLATITYWNSFEVPFIWDDTDSIVENRNLESETLWGALQAPDQSPLSSRPVAALSFAINYRLGERDPFGYHLGNLLLHILSAVVLLDILRTLLGRLGLPPRRNYWTALLVATLWTVHPVNTEAVTYITQRTELLAGLFLLTTLWAAARSWDSPRSVAWTATATVACLLGMLSKEIMVGAPILVVLMDRAFRYEGFKDAFRSRRLLYALLVLTWVPLLALVLEGGRSRSVGTDMGLSSFEYALRQLGVISHYFKIWVMPTGLCLDHGENYHPGGARIVVGALLVLPLAAVAVGSWFGTGRGRLAIGFAACFVLIILAPTSSVLPIVSEIAAERRMYLPMAALTALVGGIAACSNRAVVVRGIVLIASLLVPVFMTLAIARNGDYSSEERIWQDTLSKAPDNTRAIQNLGVIAFRKGDIAGALDAFRRILDQDPDHPHANVGLGTILVQSGEFQQGIPYLRRGIRVIPDHAVARNSLGVALLELGDVRQALPHLEYAVEVRPQDAESWNSLGAAHSRAASVVRLTAEAAREHRQSAIEKLNRAIELREAYPEAHANLGRAYMAVGQNELARRHLDRAFELNPDLRTTVRTLADLRFRGQDFAGAEQLYTRLLADSPRDANLLVNLGSTRVRMGDKDGAIESYEKALEVQPDHRMALRFTGILYHEKQQYEKARNAYLKLVTLDRNDHGSHLALARIYRALDDDTRSKYHAQEALRIRPDSKEAKELLRG